MPTATAAAARYADGDRRSRPVRRRRPQRGLPVPRPLLVVGRAEPAEIDEHRVVPAGGRAGPARLWRRQTSAASRTGEHDLVCDSVAVAGRPCWSRSGPPPASGSAASGTCRRINGNARTSRCPTRRTADLHRRTADLRGVNSVRCGARTSDRCGGGDDDCRQHHQRPGRDVPRLRTGTRRRPPDQRSKSSTISCSGAGANQCPAWNTGKPLSPKLVSHRSTGRRRCSRSRWWAANGAPDASVRSAVCEPRIRQRSGIRPHDP
jgi:hypothetical protein